MSADASILFPRAARRERAANLTGELTPRRSSLVISLVRFQHRQERLLRDVHLADHLHALLARGLLRPELALAGDVAAVAFGRHVLFHGRDRLARDYAAADGGLD